jgi:DNA polymerase III delta prime subunit
MANEKENTWLETLERQSGIRRAIILHGNIGDVCYNIDIQEYQPALEVTLQTLKRKGFDLVVLWDRFNGIQNISDSERQQLEHSATMGDRTCEEYGEAYDVDSDDFTSHGNATAPEMQGVATPDPNDFFAVIYHHLIRKPRKRYAFVVDWSHYLFGNPKSLTEQERQWLLILSKTLRNAPLKLDVENIDKPASMIVFICNNLSGIPPAFYQNNPLVEQIVVPIPSRTERESFLKRSMDLWLLNKPLRPGTVDFNDFVDSLQGLSLRDLQQMIKLSRQVGNEPLIPEKLVNLYKYGEKTSPWEELSREKLQNTEDILKQWVKGQDEAVKKVRDVIIRAYTGLSGLQHSKKQKMPKGVLFFVGPTGVGKTELAKALARFLFGDEDACLRFDMSEFNHEQADQRLVGAPPGYVGYEEGGQLTNAVKRRPFCVLLFDEIEKAHPKILDKFLQILEDGRLTDGRGETVYFSETVIIFTSNIGAADVEISEDIEEVKKQFIKKVEEHFICGLKRPELLNRIGNNIVPFNFITDDNFLTSIARAKLRPIREFLKEKYGLEDLVFSNEEKALKALVATVDHSKGGRGVGNQIVTCIQDPLAEFLFSEEEDKNLYAGRKVRAIQAGNAAKFAFTLE